MPNNTCITPDQLSTLIWDAELGGNAKLAQHFSYAEKGQSTAQSNSKCNTSIYRPNHGLVTKQGLSNPHQGRVALEKPLMGIGQAKQCVRP
jgi:hypothetical protein